MMYLTSQGDILVLMGLELNEYSEGNGQSSGSDLEDWSSRTKLKRITKDLWTIISLVDLL